MKRIAAARNARVEPAEDADRSPMELRVGARLRHARLLNRMRLKDVAERAKCSEGMLSKIENDRAVPSLTTLHRLCKALNLSVSALLNKDFAEPWTILCPAERAVSDMHRAPAPSRAGMRNPHPRLLSRLPMMTNILSIECNCPSAMCACWPPSCPDPQRDFPIYATVSTDGPPC